MAAKKPQSGDAQTPGRIRLAPRVVVPKSALRFSTARSGGPGGQNVNRRSTKVELRVALRDLPLGRDAMRRLRELAGNKLIEHRSEPGDDEVLIVADEHRSQKRNREACLDRLGELLVRARAKPKPRKPTRPTRASERRRLEEKRKQGEKKHRRRSLED